MLLRMNSIQARGSIARGGAAPNKRNSLGGSGDSPKIHMRIANLACWNLELALYLQRWKHKRDEAPSSVLLLCRGERAGIGRARVCP